MPVPDPVTQPCLSAEQAFALLGIERKTGYRAIKDGSFPVPVIRVGRLIRVPAAPLARLLDGHVDDGGEPEEAQAKYPDRTGSRRRRHLAASG